MQVLWEKAISKKLYAKVPHRELLIGTCLWHLCKAEILVRFGSSIGL
jgi:hypothetical protein